MYGTHFLSLLDRTSEEISLILDTARKIKASHARGEVCSLLQGKSLAMFFQKPSNRTRVSFEVGMYQLGGNALIIRTDEIKMGEREPIEDVAKVFSRYVDCVMMRVIRHTDIEEFAGVSSIPVINGLSDLYHPCQAISDMLTLYEHLGELKGRRLCYMGDGNNVCQSLINVSNLLGIEVVVSCPEGYDPIVNSNAGPFELVRDPNTAAKNCDVIYTDVWTSMGQEEEMRARRKAFEGYTVTEEIMQRAKKDALFMHCLPAHRGEEVNDTIVDAPCSVVFDQAENRLHAQKAILALLMVKDLEL
jgi:ornithine carbamoyltransferase